MYHEITFETQRKRRRTLALIALFMALVIVLVAFTVESMQQASREQGAASLRESILSSALQCCAIEGAYPQSLQYLEDNYGLTVNHQDYIISYEAFASNLMPSVVVTPR